MAPGDNTKVQDCRLSCGESIYIYMYNVYIGNYTLCRNTSRLGSTWVFKSTEHH